MDSQQLSSLFQRNQRKYVEGDGSFITSQRCQGNISPKLSSKYQNATNGRDTLKE